VRNLHRGSLYKESRSVSSTVSGAIPMVLLQRSMRVLCISAPCSTIARGFYELAPASRSEHSMLRSSKLPACRKRVPQRVPHGIVINPHHTRFTYTTKCVMPNDMQVLNELPTLGRSRLTSHIRWPRSKLSSSYHHLQMQRIA